jgi:hypothetical protein
MTEKIKPSLPLEFQKIKEIEKIDHSNKVRAFTNVEFYESHQVQPENFYKPISKLIPFEFK